MALRSAIYLAGNKYKLYDTIKPHLQDGKREILVDVFGGSGIMTLNASHDKLFEDYVYNEKAKHLFELQNWVKHFDGDDAEEVDYINNFYKSDKSGFLLMREDFNESIVTSLPTLYNLMCRSNSNMMRFNSKGDYNMTFGERNRCDVPRVWYHSEQIQDVDLENEDFGDLLEEYTSLNNLSKYTFYVDPPYFATTATYNENGGWTQNDNTTLLEYCLELQNKGAKVVISNVFKNRGNTHQELVDWCEENKETFTVHHLNISYNNSSFRKGKGETDEVLIVSK
ncbi:putative Dam family site-specific DNA-(adenine-N6)-methyltransferase [Vibrio phage 277E43-1]|nr:putative Dam family site-specific DNA-(adenine-N6)-methyltransferase [Vibrio phage 277E43-1]